ncbi:MAG: biotin--[acetyl-CoA-carboxylase] ligase [Puniceicoccales bacterium]|jgi:BirA family biotin operon repressor/biotin-[acetyl-CoA-carboxylase] ligase|nr:biotin--[acetyl-CoA-carboxylase] ligase [Puniceicoccales bacterium]
MDTEHCISRDEIDLGKIVGRGGIFEGFAVSMLDEIGSTQDEGWKLLRGGESGAVVVANRQSNGRGRCGRKWHGCAGNVYMTIALSNLNGDTDLQALSFQMAEGVSAMFTEKFGVAVHPKAPNDLMLGDGKIGGILIEFAGTSAAIGVGINLIADDRLQSQCSQQVGSLDEFKSLKRDEVISALCTTIGEVLAPSISG